MKLLKSRWSDI